MNQNDEKRKRMQKIHTEVQQPQFSEPNSDIEKEQTSAENASKATDRVEPQSVPSYLTEWKDRLWKCRVLKMFRRTVQCGTRLHPEASSRRSQTTPCWNTTQTYSIGQGYTEHSGLHTSEIKAPNR